MAKQKQCEFFLVRYMPDVVKGEFVNVGAVLLEEGMSGFTGVRFTRDWRRVRCIDPDVEVEFLESYEAELLRLLDSRGAEVINYQPALSRRDWLLGQMQQGFSGALQISFAQAILTESPKKELAVLAERYLESAVRGRRLQTGRRIVLNAMRDAFEQAGVWPLMMKNIEVSRYAENGDPFKIDCGYRPNGVIHLFHAVSIASDVNYAKVLTFSYDNVREGLSNAEHAECHMTAITEDGLDLQDEGVAFALSTLRDSDIETARVSEMPQIAERARVELKL